MSYCKVYLWAAEVRGEPMSWKITQSICFLRLCFSALYRKSNAVSSSRGEFLLFHVTNQAKTHPVRERARRKEVPGCCWTKKNQRREVDRREPRHAHSCSSTCQEEKYWVKGRKQNRNALPLQDSWPRAILDVDHLLHGGWVWVLFGRTLVRHLVLAPLEFSLPFLWDNASQL